MTRKLTRAQRRVLADYAKMEAAVREVNTFAYHSKSKRFRSYFWIVRKLQRRGYLTARHMEIRLRHSVIFMVCVSDKGRRALAVQP